MYKNYFMNITFLNHASYILESENTKILFDPYLYGTAFNNSWKLFNEEKHDLSDINYIFFSHEHPDHFQVDFIKNHFNERRDEITILYQETYDKRIKTFCSKLGYNFLELPNYKEILLENDLKITLGKVPFYDSWVMVSNSEKNILNVNDCVLEDPSLVHTIKKISGDSKIDVLLTQFSYAGFADYQHRSINAKSQLETIKLQDTILKPKNIIPFASFIYFAHKESFYMNDFINTPEITETFLKNNISGNTIWLKPNEKWKVNEKKDNHTSIAYWMQFYNNINSLPKVDPGESVNILELEKKYQKYITRIKSKNNRFLLSIYNIALGKYVNMHLYDIDTFIKINLLTGIITLQNKPENFIKLHSETLAFVFDFDFGIDTFSVSARFESDAELFNRFCQSFAIGELNNTGKYLKFSDFYKFFQQGIFKRLINFITLGPGNKK
jgi:UDP-MurNAc hydroxylase